MPRLNEYICVGFCSGYQDGDYAVSGQVANLSRERFMELMATVQFASKAAIEMWLDAERKRHPEQIGQQEK